MMDRFTRMCKRYWLQVPWQEGFRRQRSTQQVHCVIEDVTEKKGKSYLSYMDFDTAFNSPKDAGLW